MICLRRQRSIRLDVPGISEEQVAAFLARPRRTLRALLSRRRLELLGPGQFAYASRPFGLGQWRLQPWLHLHAAWHEPILKISSLECRIEGLGTWQQVVTFRFEAELKPEPGACRATVVAELQVDRRGALALLPQSLLEALGDQALEQALARMERRCQRGLHQQLLALQNTEAA